MTSLTGEFSGFTKKTSEDTTYPRNAHSTIKRPRQYQRHKFVNIAPLRLAEIKKELEEAQTFPFWEAKPAEDESDKENDKPPTLQNSFDINLSGMTLATPAKQPIKDGDFSTPKPHTQPTIPQKANRMLNFQYATPINRGPPPRVQCTVNMQTYLKTPITKIVEAKEDVCDLEPIAPQPSLSFKKLKVNDVEYLILNMLGKGGSSEVYHCFDPDAKTHRAVKCVSLENKSSASGFINEIGMLKTLQKCNRIIKMFDYEIREKEKTLLVVLEVGGADLSKILKESAANTDHMPVYMLLYYWMEMLYAVKQIHSNGIIHSDLKPANFLKVEGYLKLIDFGIATCIQSDMTSVIKAVPEGSFNYISPEAVNNESTSNADSPSYKPKYKLNFKSDVWSLGCILYQLVYRRTPFQNMRHIWTKLARLVDPYHKIDYPEADWVPKKIIETMKKCLQYNVKLRPSVDELIIEYENVFHSL